MKKLHFMLIPAFICVLLFASCGQELNTEKSGPLDPLDLSSRGNDNDQGEDEDNGKKPPVIDQLIKKPKDDFKVKTIPFQIGTIDTSMSSRKNHDLFTIIRSKEDLDNVASDRYYQYWTGTGGPFNVYYLKDFTEKYDSNYFSENALVLYLFTSGSGGSKIDVTEVLKQGNKLTVITDITWGMLTVITHSTVVLEVSKDDVDGVTTLIAENLKRL